MTSIDFVIPGDPNTPTGGHIYDREIVAGLRALGWRANVHSVEAGSPWPTPAALRAARATFAAIPDGALVVIDGVALPGLERVLTDEARRLTLVALVHHPAALETGLDAETAARYEDAERRALALVRRVITPSQWTARALGAYAVPVGALRIVEPGATGRSTRGSTDPERAGSDTGEHQTLNLLCVATLTPRKGHALLIEALGELRDRRWHLNCAGSLLRDTATVAAVERQIDRLRLTSRVSLLGDLGPELLEREYRRADLFVLPSYLEGYGMALAEAVVHGLPVVSTTAGAIPETVPASCAVLVPPGDSRALTKALAALMDEPARRDELARNARAAKARLPTWSAAAEKFAAALDGLAPPPSRKRRR